MVSCLVSFSLLDFDSDNADMEFGKEYFYTLTKNLKVNWLFLFSVYIFSTLFIGLSICCFLRGGGTARPTLCPLVLLIPSVRGDGQLRPGASQQYLQETLSGEVQGRHSHAQDSLSSQAFLLCTVAHLHVIFFFCMQAISSISVLLLEDQLFSEAGAGHVIAGRQPAQGHLAGRWQWKWDFHLVCPVRVSRWESGATGGPPSPAGR